MSSNPPEPSSGVGADETGGMSQTTVGLLYTTAAFTVWGVSPLFWKQITDIPARELIAHRIVWCFVMIAVLLTARRGWGSLGRVLRRPRTVLVLVATTTLIAVNWFLYIHAVASGNILQASLGYFINPLVNVLLGLSFLGERLRTWQWFSVALAAVGVSILTWRVGEMPWLSLALAFTFGFYGLLRKRVAASPEEGLAVETGLLTPFMLVLLLRLGADDGAFGRDTSTNLFLIGTGLITLLPLLWFTHGARRLPLATVGILQYLAPTMQFLLAVGVYGETFTTSHLIAFVCIWIALAVFTVDTERARRGRRRAAI